MEGICYTRAYPCSQVELVQVHDLVFPCDSKTSNNDETFSATLQSSTDEDDTYPRVVGSAQSLDVSDDDSDLSY